MNLPYSPSNIDQSGLTQTTSFFSNYFQPSTEITQSINDSILSYFEQDTGDLESAKLLAQTIVQIARDQNEDPLAILNSFQQVPLNQLTALLCTYLNTTRVNTSYLGIKKSFQQNEYVTRTIIT